ncbi:MAG: XdhC/CoxI family protein [Clostridiales bacterium]
MNLQHEIYQEALAELAAGRRSLVLTKLNRRCADAPAKILFKEAGPASIAEDESPHGKLVRAAWAKGRLQYSEDKEGNVLIAEPYVPESRLIILGGGHIALPLAEFGAKCGFAVTVTDDRPAFANHQRFPLASNVFCESFERCFPLLNIDKSAFVVIVTRGHRHDMDCLRQVLKLDTAYTGMIGSRRRVQAIMRQLADEGYPEEKLAAVCSPIGLDIGAVTPEEIAISILSEVIRYKRKSSNANWAQSDKEVLAEMEKAGAEPRALVTVIETKGSVPREAGAKMILWPQGKTLGSIGGGCSESEVIKQAYDVIRNGGYKIIDIDMTGDVAENEGMVCGGIMKVIVEQLL